ncbi:hypothetical protein KJS94_15050 [Flavihumibacter rivuli]|uniref:hypothetical protein n=1 Tax=Flavihumibacter rivuli TaxID=2838156 RepID=UPI001BDF5360|nr:hypothetical protein [Flavihumibacter rivuli]ULQ55966.1 hypothetical protein KJS94_15050 [Flavihumibacter rivuli]
MSKENVDPQLKHIEELRELFDKLQKHFNVQESEILDALYLRLDHKYNFEWAGDIWNLNLSFDDAKHILEDFDFAILRDVIETDISLLPSDLRINRKARVKFKGDIWVIHKYDQDPFPSCPHAHNIYNGIKLDLSNGKCYRVRKHIYTLNRKDFLEFRKNAVQVFKGVLPTLTLE